MGDLGVRSTNIFEFLNQPKKDKSNSASSGPSRSEAKKEAAKRAAAKAKAEAKAAAAKTPATAPHDPKGARTGNKRGGIANKGTQRTGGPRPQRSDTDHRGKRTQDRVSVQHFQKGHGTARKGGLHQGGKADIIEEAHKATEEANQAATDAATATAATTTPASPTATSEADAKAAEEAKKKEEEEAKKKAEEERDKRKTMAEYQAELKAKEVAGDKKSARAPGTTAVSGDLKEGEKYVSKKGAKESLLMDGKIKGDTATKPKTEEEKKKKKKGKKIVALDQFNTTDAAAATTAAATTTSTAPATTSSAAATAASGTTGPSSQPARGTNTRPPRGGPRGRGPRGPPLDFKSAFPPLNPSSPPSTKDASPAK